MTVAESALQWAVNIANDQSHGYSQANRWGPDYDCSSLVIAAYKQAGVKTTATYTGNMTLLLQCGFSDVTSKVNLNTQAGLQKGDILYWHDSGTSGHTCMYAGNGKIVHARGQSYGSSKTGDQGTEIAVTSYYRGKWQHVYRYTGSVTVNETEYSLSTEKYSVTVNMPLIKYGSVGSSVNVWQTILGIESDGEFGTQTQAATLGFQNNHHDSHGLVVDGEVGPKTWTVALNELT